MFNFEMTFEQISICQWKMISQKYILFPSASWTTYIEWVSVSKVQNQ